MYEQRFSHRMVVVTCLLAATSLCNPSRAAEFSDEATALPYPPDTQNLEFTALAGDINLESQSPLNKLQSMVSSEDDPSFGQLYEFDFPSYFEIQLGEYFNFSLSVPGVGIGGKRIEQSKGEMKIEGGRVRGTIEMPAMKVLSRQLSFTATIDAELMTPSTRIRGPGRIIALPTGGYLPMRMY